jgi:hypothetical protein
VIHYRKRFALNIRHDPILRCLEKSTGTLITLLASIRSSSSLSGPTLFQKINVIFFIQIYKHPTHYFPLSTSFIHYL